jgi:hypothetical protein
MCKEITNINKNVGTSYTDILDFWKLVTGNVANVLVM